MKISTGSVYQKMKVKHPSTTSTVVLRSNRKYKNHAYNPASLATGELLRKFYTGFVWKKQDRLGCSEFFSFFLFFFFSFFFGGGGGGVNSLNLSFAGN